MSSLNRIALFCLMALWVGCGSEAPPATSPAVETVDAPNKPNNDTANGSENDLQVFVLPAPLQVATILKTEHFDYREDLLYPVSQGEGTQTAQSISLGFYLIDLGYMAVYDERQQSLQYLKRIKELMDQLGIVGMMENEVIKRFERNIESPDSLSKIILESYTLINDHFAANEQEDLGLLILSGCYLEGLYITLNSFEQDHPLSLYMKLLDQHEGFLNNILALSDLFVYKGESHLLFSTLPGIAMDMNKVKESIYNGEDQALVKQNIETLRNGVNQVRSKLFN